jgi:hypothetical protein
MESADQGATQPARKPANVREVVEVVLGVHEMTDLVGRLEETAQDGVLEPQPGGLVEREPARASEPG